MPATKNQGTAPMSARIALTCLYNDRPEDRSGWKFFHGETIADAVTAMVNHFGFTPENPVVILGYGYDVTDLGYFD